MNILQILMIFNKRTFSKTLIFLNLLMVRLNNNVK